MTIALHVQDEHGEREIAPGALPLALGGADAALALPGLETGPPLAWVGAAEGHPFVQPAAGGPPVMHNGERIERSSWLRDGDVIAFAGALVRCEMGEDTVRLVAQPATPAATVVPPASPPPPTTRAMPPDQRAASLDSPRPARRQPRSGALLWVVLACFALLVVAAGYVFTATPVSLVVTPEPDRLSLGGALPAFGVGGRRLMVPGVYELEADLTGHHPLRTTIEVTSGERLDLVFELDRLPGLVHFGGEPAIGVSVTVDEHSRGVTPIAPLELAAGAHLVLLEAPRHRPLELTLEVEGLGRSQTLDVALEPLWAPVSFASSPPGAGIWLGETLLGNTPLTYELLEGRHLVEARLERHDPLPVEIEVRAQVPLEVPPLELRESDAVVRVTSRPRGASVSLDGQFAGRTPADVPVRPGETHRIRLTLAGHRAAEREVTLGAAETASVELSLAKLYGVVFVTATPADAELLVDGKSVGNANRRLKLSAVAHRLEVRKDGYETFSRKVTPRPGTSLQVEAVLSATRAAKAAAEPVVLRTGAGQELRIVRPAEEFVMGASRREQGARANEDRRLVALSQPFYFGVKEVTNAQFRAFRPAHSAGTAGSHSLDGDPQPAVNVSWNDAVEYLNWLSTKDGLPPAYERDGDSYRLAEPLTVGYRLPTEAEWAFVARHVLPGAGRYPWLGGFPPPAQAGNFADEAASGLLANTLADYADGYAVSAPVGAYPAYMGTWFDIAGNVAEWCHDFYSVYPDAAGRLVRDPRGPATGTHHVVRGSSWRHSTISELRLSYRDYSAKPRQDLGFRIARYAR